MNQNRLESLRMLSKLCGKVGMRMGKRIGRMSCSRKSESEKLLTGRRDVVEGWK